MKRCLHFWHPYQGMWASIATMHGKDRAIAPPFGRLLALTVSTAPGIDTDRLGTFTGEVERRGTLVEAARTKALLAIKVTGSALGIGSEGAFGPDPQLPILASGVEALVLRHAASGHEVTVVRRTMTNYANAVLNVTDDPEPFLKSIGFPDHAVIVRPEAPENRTGLVKGISSIEALSAAMKEASRFSDSGRIMLQSDMRAHLNPTRMHQIGRLARRLAAKTTRCCAACGRPGFGLIDVERGLPCQGCGTPTTLPRAEIHGCKSCAHTVKRFERLSGANPRWCLNCNP